MRGLRAKLVVGALALAAAIALLLGPWLDREMESLARAQIVEMLLREGTIMRAAIAGGALSRHEVESLMAEQDLRLTLIDSTGRVLYDTNVDSMRLGSVENHLHRPEIQDALRAGSGTYSRRSATTGVEQMYAAHRAPLVAVLDGVRYPVEFVRLSIALTDADARVAAVRTRIIVAGLLILLLVAAAAAVVAQRVVRPVIAMAGAARAISAGDLSRRATVRTSDELGALARAINTMVEKLQKDIADLERLGRYRSEFLGDVSHELRTPIFAVQGSLETVLGDAAMPADVRRRFLETAIRNTERLNALVADLVEISRIEAGELRLSLRYFDIAPLLREIAADFRDRAAAKGLSLAVETTEAEVSVYGDRERLRQVIVNLVDNAVKNTEHGSITVRARASDGHARIAVADTGIGIAREHLPRIFERFYRVDKDRSRSAGGTGLGLAIVKHIVEAHGTTIHVESTENRGSTFWFELRG